MGVHDFEGMFDTIDLSRKGVVTADQLHVFCEDLYFSPICIQHIEGAIRVVSGSSGMVTRREFLDVLTEVERRRATEEQAYWDFQVSVDLFFFQGSNQSEELKICLAISPFFL
jgi:Ca2+-binding EF-hand superfamily protein